MAYAYGMYESALPHSLIFPSTTTTCHRGRGYLTISAVWVLVSHTKSHANKLCQVCIQVLWFYNVPVSPSPWWASGAGVRNPTSVEIF